MRPVQLLFQMGSLVSLFLALVSCVMVGGTSGVAAGWFSFFFFLVVSVVLGWLSRKVSF